MSDKASNNEKDFQRSNANREKFYDLQGIDNDKNIHYPRLPASLSENRLSKSHNKGGNTRQKSLKSSLSTPDILFPPLSFHPLLENYEDKNKKDFEYSSDDKNNTNMSYSPILSLTEAFQIKSFQERNNWVE